LDLILFSEHGSVQEIIDPFVVNLHEGNVYGNFSVAISTGLLYLTKQKPGAPLDKSQVLLSFFVNPRKIDPLIIWNIFVTLHGECLARTSLSIGKDSTVEPLDDLPDHKWNVTFVENLRLRNCTFEDLVEAILPAVRTMTSG
jgi:hypothetical protein